MQVTAVISQLNKNTLVGPDPLLRLVELLESDMGGAGLFPRPSAPFASIFLLHRGVAVLARSIEGNKNPSFILNALW